MKQNLKRIVCIGGGTGTFVALKGLKTYPCHLSAIVTMSDSGGSNKRIRDEFGLLPTSDIRQSLVALSDENGGSGVMRKLFMYRFAKGTGISGMTFGNLFMAALSDILGSQKEAIRQTGRVLRIKGTVIPVSFTDTNLMATYEDGHTVSEEHVIDEPPHDGKMKITSVTLKPEAQVNPDAVAAILKADLVILGPGDLYTSLIPNLLVPGIPEALAKTKAKIVYVLNLMTKYGQTYNFTAKDHLAALERYVGSSIDFVLVNSAAIPKSVLSFYAKYNELPVTDDLGKTTSYNVVHAKLASRALFEKDKSDTLMRSLIRHDSARLGEALIAILQGQYNRGTL